MWAEADHPHVSDYAVSYAPDEKVPTEVHFVWYECNTCREYAIVYPIMTQIPEGVTLHDPERNQAIYDALYPS